MLAWTGAILFPLALFTVLALPGVDDPFLQAVTVLVALLLPVALARRSPLAALTLLVVGGGAVSVLAISGGLPEQAAVAVFVVLADVMVGNVAARRPRRVSVPAAVLTVLVQAALVLLFENPGDLLTIPAVMALAGVTAWVIGDSVRQRRRHAAVQREQSEARAVEAERLRIARELHDMVAHSIAVIAVQAGMGRRVIDTQPAEARNALANIEETSRDTAAALRRMLGSLRRTDAGAGPAPRDPAPGLADLDGLVARSAQAGVEVGLRRDGDPVPLPPDIDLSAYRIVQEAVTNVIRHAGVGRCDVAVQQDAGTLSIEITDDGSGGGGAGDGSRNGITGMRERVSLLGGEFDAGPRPGGGFRVSARIPLPEAVR
ncbi:signal transduction histidine kinase [Actinoplanes xinjiangensis]|uniref:histidine kinase n=1 Tax=Actinoplanes xinjiangensis TaxID=512350 RepID=A0A316F8U1_9ACTN|nr:signal transduction histidine kinase [Actinoplanes xinjiangensis]GIF38080.1 two-component sensor histidine kinase [Actinoplanes xinjiangensis]